MTRARSLSLLANANILTAEQTNNRVGIGSTIPDAKLDVDGDIVVGTAITIGKVSGIVSATDFYVDGISITGAAGTWATFTSGGEGGISTTKKVKIENSLEVTGVSTFSGNLTVGGVLTYDDVTNVDSVGIVTARSGIEFGASGVGGTITALGHGGFTGIVTALGFEATGVVTAASFRGDGSQLSGVDSSNLVDSGDTNRVAANTSGVVITGIATATEFLHVLGQAGTSGKGIEARANSTQSTDTNKAIRVRNNSDTDTFSLSYRGAATFGGNLTIPDYIVHTGDSNTKFGFESADTFEVQTGGSEALKIDSSQRINIGGAAVSQTRTVNIGSNAEANLAIETHNDATSETANIRFYKSGNTAASPQIVEANDNIAQLLFYGHDGTDYANAAAAIKASVDGTPGANDMPGKLTFFTNAGGTSASERLRIDSSGDVHIGDSAANANGHGLLSLTDSASAAFNALVIQQGNTGYTATDGLHIGIDASVDSYIKTFENRDIYFTTGTTNSEKLRINNDGSIVPGSDDSQDLGSTSKRWANIYSADLQLSNEGKSNDVDGTWGKYTIQEGENDLFLLNRRNGKKYRFMLEEV